MFCTYVSCHSIGKYYIGKAQLEKVQNGYVGSGVVLKKYFKKYPKAEWDTQIIQTFENEADAYAHEATLVTEDTIADPACLNMRVGGLGNSKGFKPKPEAIEKMRLKLIGYVHTKERNAKISAGLKGRKLTPEHIANSVAAKAGKPYKPRRPEHAEKIRLANISRTGTKMTPEQVAAMRLARWGK